MADTAAMPKSIVNFERLAYASLVISVLSYVLFDRREIQELGVAAVAIVGVIVCAIVVALIWAIARQRQSWARWVFTILTVLALAAQLYAMIFPETGHTVGRFLGDLVVIVLDLAALYFLWARDSSEWLLRRLA